MEGSFESRKNLYFEVKVKTGSKLISLKRLTVYSLYNELSLKLSRWNKTTGIVYDFEIAAYVEDIDDEHADIKVE